jgi:signal peptidase II
MLLGEEINFLGDRGMLHYTENNGMAFGMELGGEMGKLALTLIPYCGGLWYWLWLVHLLNTNITVG